MIVHHEAIMTLFFDLQDSIINMEDGSGAIGFQLMST